MMCVCGELTRRYKYFEFLAREDPSHQSTLEPRHEAKMKKIICMQSDCLLLHMYVLPHISEMPSLYRLCCNSMNGRTDELDSLSSLDISVERWPYDERRRRKKSIKFRWKWTWELLPFIKLIDFVESIFVPFEWLRVVFIRMCELRYQHCSAINVNLLINYY